MREAFLSLTPAGRAIYEDIAPVALALARRFIEAIDPADRAAFDRALKAVTARAKKLTQ
jgi:DNA-binding MarR family transcriptional regulator